MKFEIQLSLSRARHVLIFAFGVISYLITAQVALAAPVVEAVPLWESHAAEGRVWTEHALTSMKTYGQALLTTKLSDSASFCPKYNGLSAQQKREFWVYLLSAMTKYESNFKLAMTYKELFKDSKGEFVISRGLLQISFESSEGYSCGFADEEAIYDPELNLDCGIKILNFWITRDRSLAGRSGNTWRGGARYWSTLRSTGTPYAEITKLTRKLPFCN